MSWLHYCIHYLLFQSVSHRLQVIAKKVRANKKEALLQKLMAYWTLKRQSRNGVPLVRRLQNNSAAKPTDKVVSANAINHSRASCRYITDTEWVVSLFNSESLLQLVEMVDDAESAAANAQLKYWKRLRQDLEKARLLVELIRKREKLKKEEVGA